MSKKMTKKEKQKSVLRGLENNYIHLVAMDNAFARLLSGAYTTAKVARDEFYEVNSKLSKDKVFDASKKIIQVSTEAARVEHKTRMASIDLRQQYLKTKTAKDADFGQYIREIEQQAPEISIEDFESNSCEVYM